MISAFEGTKSVIDVGIIWNGILCRLYYFSDVIVFLDQEKNPQLLIILFNFCDNKNTFINRMRQEKRIHQHEKKVLKQAQSRQAKNLETFYPIRISTSRHKR